MRQRDLDLKSQEPDKLLIEIRTLIEEARRQTAVAVNIGLTLSLGASAGASTVVLSGERAVYGEQIVVTLSRQLTRSSYSTLLRLSQGLQISGLETGKLPRSPIDSLRLSRQAHNCQST
jgi:hypothetical protein